MRDLHDHIRTARDPGAADRLAGRLADGCWPGGADRIDPVASEWLRRWHPRGATAPAAGCDCASGRCTVCN